MVLTLITMLSGLSSIALADVAVLNRLNTISTVASTVPSKDDVNPYDYRDHSERHANSDGAAGQHR